MTRGIVIRVDSVAARERADRLGLGLEVRQDWAMPWEHVMFACPAVSIPWDIVLDGFELTSRWDIAAPLSVEWLRACDVGSDADRLATEAVCGDLAQPLYSSALMFARRTESAARCFAAWADEDHDGDERLAFLRALHIAKPLICALPRWWLMSEDARRKVDELGLDSAGMLPGTRRRP